MVVVSMFYFVSIVPTKQPFQIFSRGFSILKLDKGANNRTQSNVSIK